MGCEPHPRTACSIGPPASLLGALPLPPHLLVSVAPFKARSGSLDLRWEASLQNPDLIPLSVLSLQALLCGWVPDCICGCPPGSQKPLKGQDHVWQGLVLRACTEHPGRCAAI